MTCRQCGTRIADKALICYKCGTATTEAKYAPVPIARPRSFASVAILMVLAMLLFLGVYAGETGTSETARATGWAVAVVSVLLIAARLLRGRHRSG